MKRNVPKKGKESVKRSAEVPPQPTEKPWPLPFRHKPRSPVLASQTDQSGTMTIQRSELLEYFSGRLDHVGPWCFWDEFNLNSIANWLVCNGIDAKAREHLWIGRSRVRGFRKSWASKLYLHFVRWSKRAQRFRDQPSLHFIGQTSLKIRLPATETNLYIAWLDAFHDLLRRLVVEGDAKASFRPPTPLYRISWCVVHQGGRPIGDTKGKGRHEPLVVDSETEVVFPLELALANLGDKTYYLDFDMMQFRNWLCIDDFIDFDELDADALMKERATLITHRRWVQRTAPGRWELKVHQEEGPFWFLW